MSNVYADAAEEKRHITATHQSRYPALPSFPFRCYSQAVSAPLLKQKKRARPCQASDPGDRARSYHPPRAYNNTETDVYSCGKERRRVPTPHASCNVGVAVVGYPCSSRVSGIPRVAVWTQRTVHSPLPHVLQRSRECGRAACWEAQGL
jgi:hypothetical protein